MPKNKILITAGGTGGHIFPAQGLAQQLKQRRPDWEILFVGGGLQKNRYFDRTSFPFEEVACSPLISKNPLKVGKGLFHLAQGTTQSYRILKKFNPDLVVGFGSFYTIPILLAAKLLKMPIILHEANSIPGKANKWFAPYVECVGVHFPATGSLLKGKSIEVGLPLREGFKKSSLSQDAARSYFNLKADIPTLLIFGGSQGALGINTHLKYALEKGLPKPLQVIHLTGDAHSVETLSHLYHQQGITACVKQFENCMNKAWSAADLFIGRSGASTIAEAMEFEIPGILIPYPFAAENHQEMNADFFVETVGGGVKILEKDLSPQRLIEQLNKLMSLTELTAKKQAIEAYKKRDVSIDLCQLVENLIKRLS